MTPQQQINQIDKNITAIHHYMRQLEKIDPFSAVSWQAAWDKHPDLRQKVNEFLHRRDCLRDELAKKNRPRNF